MNIVLLDNIKYVTDILKETYHIPHATQLVLRIIFVRYMIDRGVDIGYPGFGTDVLEARQNLIRLCEDREKLYDFFSYLKKHLMEISLNLQMEKQIRILTRRL